MITRHLFDKEKWHKGPWQDECDYMAWVDVETCYPCVAKRNYFGAWTGFVGVDEGHPLFMEDCETEPFKFIEVHGGAVTFTAFNGAESCIFMPPKRLWWIGFDCMKDDDFCPWVDAKPKAPKSKGMALIKAPIYRDVWYVTNEILSLTKQLAGFETRDTLWEFSQKEER